MYQLYAFILFLVLFIHFAVAIASRKMNKSISNIMEKKLANAGPETTYIEMLPFIGMTIYIPDSIYIHRGCDDIQGGKATISEIHYSNHLPQDHVNYCMVKIKETGSKQYNWVYLMRNQEEYEIVYGNQIAKPDPDYSLESNPPNGGWSYFV